MKTIIYYFTGTGNSLAAAKKIAANLDDCELVPVPSVMETSGEIKPRADRVGIVCPVYFTGLPAMAALFAARLDLSGVQYTFAVLTYGGGGGESALAQLDGILRRGSGHGLSAGYLVVMPGNYILMYDSPEGEKRKEMLESADREIQKIAEEILACRVRPLSRSLISSLLHTLFYSRFIAGVHTRDQAFSVSDECSSCGICAEICPGHNIEMVEGKPVWRHHCELCCGCIHLCPAKAIQAGKSTAGRARYRNPEITVPELYNRKQ